MKLTAEQKAANAAARTSAKTANAEKLKTQLREWQQSVLTSLTGADYQK